MINTKMKVKLLDLNRQYQGLEEAVFDAFKEVFISKQFIMGPKVQELEASIATYTTCKHAIGVSSGTDALLVALMALDIQAGDEVITTPFTFFATAGCISRLGAIPVFVDIDPETWCLSVERLQEKLEQHKTSGLPLPKAVIPVHLSGQSCDMQAIAELMAQYGFRIIEDASHAIGGCYRNEPVGNCRFSDIVVFSFHPVKVITTGEGGMALTNDPAIEQLMLRLRSHGINRDPNRMTREPTGKWYYEQLELGFNRLNMHLKPDYPTK